MFQMPNNEHVVCSEPCIAGTAILLTWLPALQHAVSERMLWGLLSGVLLSQQWHPPWQMRKNLACLLTIEMSEVR